MRNTRNVLIAGVAMLMLQASDHTSADETTDASRRSEVQFKQAEVQFKQTEVQFTQVEVQSKQSETRSENLFGVLPMLNDQILAAYRGGTAVVNDMKLSGVVSDNQAYNLVTGGNSISEGAFSGSSGMPMVIQNSGNNVLIQNATIVNVQMQ